jgi:simple sugar transport system permease protein
MAVITAMLITVPFIVLTNAEDGLGPGLRTAGQAYAALVEGALGLALNSEVAVEDVDLVVALAEANELSSRDLREISILGEELVTVGRDDVRRYAEVVARYQGTEALPDSEAIDLLGERVPEIALIGPERLREIAPLLMDLDELSRGDANDLLEAYVEVDALDDEMRVNVEEAVAAAADFDDETLLDSLRLIEEYGLVRIIRNFEQLEVLDAIGLDPNDSDAEALAAIHLLSSRFQLGVERIDELIAIDESFLAAGITEVEALSDQLRLVNDMYGEDLLTERDVAAAIRNELPQALDANLVVERPGNRVLIDREAAGTTGTIEEDERLDVAYIRLGGQTLLFFPANLEAMITRSIPYVIAGLAVALGFKAGLFNIGAQGQLFIGSTLAAWVGFSTIFSGLPIFIHLPLVLIAGFIGGAFWGMIPGALKAFTGAHEVINTIMLNFIAVRFVDFLIRSNDPPILLDTEASLPRTPFISESAMLPTFSSVATWVILAAGVLTLLAGLWIQREAIQEASRRAVRPIIYAVLVVLGGFFLRWIGVRDNLHIGLLLMIATVWFVDWFLERTTLGFELRTVGANPDAARYAGMSVKRNIILALTLSGGLAGLAGIIEISGVQMFMQPTFFGNLGFDSIAVALLARNNPRGMIPAGLLWGSLLAGAGLMQIRADIAVDIVRIIQALIIMFIAADMIIRYLWRVPEATAEEKAAALFSKGWGS